jgi:hypothetical protein
MSEPTDPSRPGDAPPPARSAGNGPPERRQEDRRSFFRGGRRASDWPETLVQPLRCPRCASPQARFVDGTPESLFWECHSCRHPWSTTPQGRLIE